MVCGNGKQGVVISDAPHDETFIFQDIDFILPNKNYRGNYDITAYLEPTRQAIINYDNTVIGKGVSDTLTNLISSKIYYYSLMTNHHMNATSAYFTDFERALSMSLLFIQTEVKSMFYLLCLTVGIWAV